MTEKLGFRWFVVVLVLALAGWATYSNWPLSYGIDLSGGVTLTYSIDPRVLQDMVERNESREEALDDTVRVIATRIDNLGVRDLSVRREGTDRILIQSPNMSESEAAEIRRRMVQLGRLEFLIGIGDLKGSAQDTVKVPGPAGTFEDYVFRKDDAEAQRQAAIAEGKTKLEEARAAGRPEIPAGIALDGMTYQLKAEDGRPLPIFWKPWAPGQTAKRKGISDEEAKNALQAAAEGKAYNTGHIDGGWLYADPEYYGGRLEGFTGKDIASPRKSRDNLGRRTVNYTVVRGRQADFEDYTGKYVNWPMCLVLNDEIWSAPTINEALYDNVEIRGGGDGFTEEDQDWLINCLQSGSLKLRPRIESEVKIGATLGDAAVDRGITSTIISAILVFAFMIVYYRFSGVVAVITLVLNLLITIALLALFRATITLPGIAGFVLTIGMAVDANILIFERIREEREKGKPLLPAVQAGFDRAFVTIIDSNLTTVITAVLLYKYGVGPIRGFAVTLMAGLVASLFTSIFVAKTLFATMLRLGALKTLTMARLLPPDLRIRFLDKAKVAVACSLVAIVISIAAFAATGDSKYGLDFTGGYIVRMNLTEGVTPTAVNQRITGIPRTDGSGAKYPQTQATGLKDSETARGNYTSFDVKIQASQAGDVATITNRIRQDLMAMLGDNLKASTEAAYNADAKEWTVEFETNQPMNRVELDTVTFQYQNAEGQSPYQAASFTEVNPTEAEEGEPPNATRWRLTIGEMSVLGHTVLHDLATAFGGQLPQQAGSVNFEQAFTKLNFIGPNVVSNLKQQAVVAVVLSIIAIILYIWFRFKELKYGFAATIAAFHDAIVALGAVVIFNAIGVVHVPIDLPIIAGFLTLIGYSLNDTIVQFDRVRENIGNIRGTYREIVNISVNQTLARTVLTALTTFFVVLVLFIANYGQESGIEGIAFTLLVGVVVGTFSTIYVASPIIVWLHNREEAKKTAGTGTRPKVPV